MNGRLPILALLLVLPGCEEAKLRQAEAPPAEAAASEPAGPSIPFFHTLTDNQGREIRAKIIGREENTITIVRSRDQERFTLPISTLTPTDQVLVRKLPITIAEPAVVRESTQRPSKRMLPPEKPEESGPVRFQRGRIEDLEKEIKSLEEQMRSEESGTIKQRSLSSRIFRLRDELKELNRELVEMLEE